PKYHRNPLPERGGAVMTEQQLRGLSPALGRYLAPYQFCRGSTQTFAHLNTSVRGLLSDLTRKTAEPIALRGGTAARTLQEFDRARANGLWLDWLTFGEEYGKAPGFVAGLEDAQLWFVGEVPRTLSCLAAHRSGRAPARHTRPRPAAEVVQSSSAFVAQPWRVL